MTEMTSKMAKTHMWFANALSCAKAAARIARKLKIPRLMIDDACLMKNSPTLDNRRFPSSGVGWP